MTIIELENTRFTYDGKANALDTVSLDIKPGEFVCVLGGNGSGKSTLAKHVNALLVPDSGEVRVLGKNTANAEDLYFIRSNAGMVFQNPDDQIVASIIEDDVAFGPENLGIAPDELRGRVTRSLKQVGLQGFEQRETNALSGGQKQRVAIAGVLAMEPQILVFDEASAMLDPRGRAGLLRVCRELNESGLTIVFITHFMEEAAFADRVIVLDGGRIALQGTPAEVFARADDLAKLNLEVPFAANMSKALQDAGVPIGVHLSVDALADAIVPLMGQSAPQPQELPAGQPPAEEPQDSQPPTEHAASDPVITFSDVWFTYQPAAKRKRRKPSDAPSAPAADWGNDPAEYWALQGVSFSLERGEFFGIAGHTGSGKSTLLQLANGLLQPTSGTVCAGKLNLADKRAAIDARRDIGVVFQYPEHQLFAATVFDDVAFGPRNLGLGSQEVESRVRHALELVHLDIDELREKSPFALSGGQQRRVAFAGVLAMGPTTLVLDEPVAGLDPRARASFLRLISELHEQQGMTIVLVSHNMNDLARLCDRILVLNQGRVIALGAPEHVFSDEAGLKSVGLGVPDVLHLANRLGLPASGRIPSEDVLAHDIAARILAVKEAG